MISLALSIVVGTNILVPISIPNNLAVLATVDRLPLNVGNFIAAKKKKYSLSNFSIGDVKVDMTDIQVIELLGKPRERTDITGCVTTTTLEYDKIAFSISSPIWSVSTSSPLYPTDQGVRVGDSIAKARKIYNRIISPSPKQRSGILEYSEMGKENLQMDLFFAHKNGKITRIEYAHYYNEDC